MCACIDSLYKDATNRHMCCVFALIIVDYSNVCVPAPLAPSRSARRAPRARWRCRVPGPGLPAMLPAPPRGAPPPPRSISAWHRETLSRLSCLVWQYLCNTKCKNKTDMTDVCRIVVCQRRERRRCRRCTSRDTRARVSRHMKNAFRSWSTRTTSCVCGSRRTPSAASASSASRE